MKATGYKWWMNRIAMNYRLYDYLRIDHFRAFSSYWEVDANAENAREGEWLEGPGLEFSRKSIKFWRPFETDCRRPWQEMTPDLEGFMREVGIPGMRVMEFAFNPGEDSSFMPHNFSRNCVAYTGTHDNNTLLGWLWDAPESTRNFCFEYCGFSGDNWGDGGTHSASCRAIIRTLWMSHAGVTIIPMQDMLGYGGDTRMNVPGTASGNWVVRFTGRTWSRLTTNGTDRLTEFITGKMSQIYIVFFKIFVCIALGFVLNKTRVIDRRTEKTLSDILLKAVFRSQSSLHHSMYIQLRR